MIRKSGYRFSEKIMLKQKDRARWRFDEKPSRSSLARRQTVEQDRVAAPISEVEGEADHQPHDKTQPSLPRQEYHQQEREGDAEDRYKRHAGRAERAGDLPVAPAQINHRAADQHEGEQRADADHFTEDVDRG